MEDYEDNDGDMETTLWEDEAASAVDSALEGAELDDIRGVIALPSEDNHRFGSEFTDMESLHTHLVEVYESAWNSSVPFDGGEAVFESDSVTYVAELLEDKKLEEFFKALADPIDSELLIASRQLILDSNQSRLLRLDLEDINGELIRYLTLHPELMRTVNPRQFEIIVAALFRDKGYDVTLTPRSNDGGLDIYAVEKKEVGSALTLVECKRYSENNRVGVEIIRGLYGVVEEKRATRGILATTSYFTKGAMACRDKMPHRLALADLNDLSRFLREWKGRR